LQPGNHFTLNSQFFDKKHRLFGTILTDLANLTHIPVASLMKIACNRSIAGFLIQFADFSRRMTYQTQTANVNFDHSPGRQRPALAANFVTNTQVATNESCPEYRHEKPLPTRLFRTEVSHVKQPARQKPGSTRSTAGYSFGGWRHFCALGMDKLSTRARVQV